MDQPAGEDDAPEHVEAPTLWWKRNQRAEPIDVNPEIPTRR